MLWLVDREKVVTGVAIEKVDVAAEAIDRRRVAGRSENCILASFDVYVFRTRVCMFV